MKPNHIASTLIVLSTLAILSIACVQRDQPGQTATPPRPATAGAGTPTAGSEVDPTPVVTRTPVPEEPTTPAADLLVLQEELQAAVDGYWVAGNYAVAVTDLQTGETISVNGDVPHLSGCVMNLFVILQVARDLEAGRYEVARADSLIAATTWSSNAQTARALYAIAGDGDATEGVRRVDALIRDVLKLETILIDHPPSYHADSIGRDYNNWATVLDTNLALAALWKGDVLSPQWRDFVLAHLAEVKAGLNYLTAAVPEGIVSHKNGFLEADTGWVDNDVGIVRLQRGDREIAYAVSFFSEEVPSKYADVVLGQQVSTLVYKVMAARYP